ncbi:MAG: class I SAM-dependent rRNA methyltransferase, partial [Thermotogota bacterium]
MIIVTVRRQKAPKIRNRYGWVFADEIVDIQADRDLGIANVFEENGGFLGKGLFLKGSSKTVRMLTLRDEEIDEPFFLRRFRRALSVRTRINPNVAYRLIN